MTNLLILFIILNIVNVILQTFKSIATVKCGKGAAALVNAIAYGLYTIVLVYTNCELGLWAKVAVVAVTNLIGVYIVKWTEEKLQKDKLWKVEATVTKQNQNDVCEMLKKAKVPYNYIEGVGKYTIFNVFCATQNQSLAVKEILKVYNAKYFVSESKSL